jgi:hypothetical protein
VVFWNVKSRYFAHGTNVLEDASASNFRAESETLIPILHGWNRVNDRRQDPGSHAFRETEENVWAYEGESGLQKAAQPV